MFQETLSRVLCLPRDLKALCYPAKYIQVYCTYLLLETTLCTHSSFQYDFICMWRSCWTELPPMCLSGGPRCQMWRDACGCYEWTILYSEDWSRLTNKTYITAHQLEDDFEICRPGKERKCWGMRDMVWTARKAGNLYSHLWSVAIKRTVKLVCL